MTSRTALHDLGVAQLAAELRERHVSAVEVAQHFLARAQQHQNLGAFVSLNEDATLAQARSADERLANGTAGPLEGRWRTKTSSSRATFPPPPGPGCWPDTSLPSTPQSSRTWPGLGR